MPADMLKKLHQVGVSVWLDSLSRQMMTSGFLKNLIDEGLRGQTSNPTIFQSAITHSQDYDDDIRKGGSAGKSAEEIVWELMVGDVQKACDMFRPLYDSSKGEDGYVSLELDPTKAHDTEGSLKQAKELWPRVNRPNLMLKVPGTTEGLPVIEKLLGEGMNVNVTLLFSVDRYKEVMEAHLKGLEAAAAAGKDLSKIASVASFFVSRVDTEVDKRLEKSGADKALQGKAAVANAVLAYEAFVEVTGSDRWKALAAKGAQVQRPLWASTGTKNPAYKDTIYVDTLIGPHCVNTMPESTLAATKDHGLTEVSLNAAAFKDAHATMDKLKAAGIDMNDVCNNTLVKEGVAKFADSYADLLGALKKVMAEQKASA